MDEKNIRKLLNSIKNDEMSIDDGVLKLKDLPYEDLGFAKIDNHRELRTGYPEVVFCQGKTSEQIASIMNSLSGATDCVLGTRASQADYDMVRKHVEGARYHDVARIISIGNSISNPSKTIAVVTAGTSDIPVAEEAAVTSEMMGNVVDRIYDVGVAGIHRLLSNVERIQKSNVVIVIAGMEGALASVVGGLVNSPVIAVPTSVGYGTNLGGVTALLSMLNSCANGIATVNIDNGFGAACMATKINDVKEGRV